MKKVLERIEELGLRHTKGEDFAGIAIDCPRGKSYVGSGFHTLCIYDACYETPEERTKDILERLSKGTQDCKIKDCEYCNAGDFAPPKD